MSTTCVELIMATLKCSPSVLSLLAVTLTLLSRTDGVDICRALSEQDCACVTAGPSNAWPSVRCNFTSSSPPSPLFGLSPPSSTVRLDTVDLSGLNLTSLPLDFFPANNATVIKALHLNGNQMPDIPAVLTRLSALRELVMADNLVTSLSLNFLKAIGGLESLNLARNKLTRLAFTEGGRLERGTVLQLKSLTLASNDITSIDNGLFATTPHLTVLDLSHNRLTQLSSTDLAYLDLSLVRLDLSHNELSSVAKTALQNLQHLRTLNLEHNPLTDLNGLHFPAHLRSLDLSHTALTIMDHCQLSSIADLTFLGVKGNDLTCTCQLYLLMQWYQNLHHMAADPDSSNRGSNWTCTDTSMSTTVVSHISPTTPSTSSESVIASTLSHHRATMTDAPSDYVLRVVDLVECHDTESHCQALEHAEHHDKGSSQMVVVLHVATSDDTLMATWTLEGNGEVIVQGFRLRYIPEDNEPITSPMLPVEDRSYMIKTSGLQQHYIVCLDVLSPDTTVVTQDCVNMKDESSNVVVGILAGVVFLVPCIVAIIYVLFKDHQVKREVARGYYEMQEHEKKSEPMDEEKGSSKGLVHACHQHTSDSLAEITTCHHQVSSADNTRSTSALCDTPSAIVRREEEAAESLNSSESTSDDGQPNSRRSESREDAERVEMAARANRDNCVQVEKSARHDGSISTTAGNVNGGDDGTASDAVVCVTPKTREQGTVNAGFLCNEGDQCHNDKHQSARF